MIWTPDERWAEDVIEECAAFPYGDHDDLVDSMTQAVMRFRQGNFVRLATDYIEDKSPKRKREYY
jgi:phage terminase large subunit-like protein